MGEAGAQEASGIFATLALASPYASKLSSVLSVASTAYSIFTGINGDPREEAHWNEVNRKLDEIQEKLDTLKQRLEAVYGEVIWTQVLGQLGAAPNDIVRWWGTLKETQLVFEKDPQKFASDWAAVHKPKLDTWAVEVLLTAPEALTDIDTVMLGKTGVTTEMLMKAVVTKIQAGGGTPGQSSGTSLSQYQTASAYFQNVLLLQHQARICLANAYLYLEAQKPEAAVIRPRDIIEPENLPWYIENTGHGSLQRFLQVKIGSVPANVQGSQVEMKKWWSEKFNLLVQGEPLNDEDRFSQMPLSPKTRALNEKSNKTKEELAFLNRNLLMDLFPRNVAARPNLTDALEFLQPLIQVDYKEGGQIRTISRLMRQGIESQKYMSSMDQYAQPQGKVVVSDDTTVARLSIGGRLRSLDINTVNADRDCVVVGLQFYSKGDRLALRIFQAPLVRGRIGYNYTAVQNDDPGENEGEHWAEFPELINMHPVEVPAGEVVTGAAFHRLGNERLSIKLQSTKIDRHGWLENRGGHWSEAQFYGSRDPVDYVVAQDGNSKWDIRAIVPSTLTPISGLRWIHEYRDRRNLLTIALRPGVYSDISGNDRVWENADVLTPSALGLKYDADITAIETLETVS